jgi:3-dehydroquinate synthase
VIPEHAYLVRDQIPLPAFDLPIEGRAGRHDVYPVTVTDDTAATARKLADLALRPRATIVTDDTVAALHAQPLVAALRGCGLTVDVVSVPPGEKSKSLAVAMTLLDKLALSSVGRRDLIIAFGGGVVIDTAGWVASAYMRGVPYANAPTTLLAAVDAALGGKVAVDHPVAKNLIGAFYQPVGVVANVGFLSTLSARQIRAGLAEAIKKGMIASPELFEFIEANLEGILAKRLPVLERLVRYASAIKCELIARDPYERDLRRPLNFGHTVGHAVETTTGYGPVLHGEAVALGMAVAAGISLARGWTEPGTYDRLITLLHRAGLPHSTGQLRVGLDVDAVIGSLAKIRQIRDGSLRFVLPLEVGTVAMTDDVTDLEVEQALLSHVPAAAS